MLVIRINRGQRGHEFESKLKEEGNNVIILKPQKF